MGSTKPPRKRARRSPKSKKHVPDPAVPSKEQSCANCRLRKIRCSGDRPACSLCLRGAASRNLPASSVRCVYSGSSMFATAEDKAFEAARGGRGATCDWGEAVTVSGDEEAEAQPREEGNEAVKRKEERDENAVSTSRPSTSLPPLTTSAATPTPDSHTETFETPADASLSSPSTAQLRPSAPSPFSTSPISPVSPQSFRYTRMESPPPTSKAEPSTPEATTIADLPARSIASPAPVVLAAAPLPSCPSLLRQSSLDDTLAPAFTSGSRVLAPHPLSQPPLESGVSVPEVPAPTLLAATALAPFWSGGPLSHEEVMGWTGLHYVARKSGI
ncbi:uncharacterized protein JCM10292_002791 [Rhodotorula paludigena]|uniref:uncharacterized protein n=1 Tax=Rhodotorula paludigena TaxID=86838 RepID=UPI0031753D0E